MGEQRGASGGGGDRDDDPDDPDDADVVHVLEQPTPLAMREGGGRRQDDVRFDGSGREEYSAASPQMAICSRRSSCVERGRRARDAGCRVGVGVGEESGMAGEGVVWLVTGWNGGGGVWKSVGGRHLQEREFGWRAVGKLLLI